MQTQHHPILLYMPIFLILTRKVLLIGFVLKSKTVLNCFIFILISENLFYVNAEIVEFVKHLLRFFLFFFSKKFSNRGCTQLKIVPSKHEIANNFLLFSVGNTVGHVRKLIVIIVNHGFNIF